jgi:hypothetical protein
MIYELWDTVSGNIVAEFDAEYDALTAVLEFIEVHSERYADCLSLLAASEDGTSQGIAAGGKLVELARRRSEVTPA